MVENQNLYRNKDDNKFLKYFIYISKVEYLLGATAPKRYFLFLAEISLCI